MVGALRRELHQTKSRHEVDLLASPYKSDQFEKDRKLERSREERGRPRWGRVWTGRLHKELTC